MHWIIIILVLCLIVAYLPYIGMFAIVTIILYVMIRLKLIERLRKYLFSKYELKYYKSEEFLSIKQRVTEYINDCNELNEHIVDLKKTQVGKDQSIQGRAEYRDESAYEYKRPEYSKHSDGERVYNCSRSVCDNARMHPFKYLCKYFDIKPTEENLETFENLLNNYEAAEDGKKFLTKKKEQILHGIEGEIPEKIKKYGYDRFQCELGFKVIEFDKIEFPRYTFLYVSPGGNASTRCDIVMDIKNLNEFIHYLSEIVKFKKSAAGQRALMTSSLRKKMLERDGYTCKKCGASVQKEPNLLLEIDHIIPISKGGLTTEDNLQTLCWRCNRRKGAKVESI